MLAAVDYRWWVLLHIAGAFGFLLAHGVSVTVAFQLRGERDRRRIMELLQLSGSSVKALYASMAVLLAGGVIAGFQADWWGHWWIWAALVLLVASVGEMTAVARPYYRRVKEGVQIRPSGVPRKSDEELDALLRSSLPMLNAGIGFAVLAVILYLMVFKPG